MIRSNYYLDIILSHRTLKLSLIIFVLFALFVINIISFSFSVVKPFTLDEVEEARMAEKINIMGPKTYHPPPEGGGEDLSHPLLYSYTNAVFCKLFGSGEVALRSYGIFFYLLSLVILMFLVQEAFAGKSARMLTAMVLSGTLYLLNPLLIQHSMLLNADNNISAFAIILYVYLFYKFERTEKISFIHSRLILALIVAFNFMCKEITPCFLLFSVVLYRVIQREYKKLILDILLNIGLGVALFWGVWYSYCRFTGTDVLAFIKFTAARKSGKVMNMDFLLRQLKHFFVIWKWPLYWVSAPFFLLIFISFFGMVKAFVKRRALQSEDFIMISSVTMFVPFIFIKPSIDMMKYQYPVYPLFIFLIAYFMVKNVFYSPGEKITERDYSKSVYFLVPFLILASIWYYKIGDYILLLWQPLPVKFIISYYLPITLGIPIFFLSFRKLGFFKSFLCALLVFVYPVSIGLNLNQTRGYTTAECWLNYGEKGLKETCEYLREHADPSRKIYCRKDIAYYLNFRYRMGITAKETTSIFRSMDSKKAEDLFKGTHVQYFVFDKVSSIQRRDPRVLNVLNTYFFVEERFGDFVILRSKTG